MNEFWVIFDLCQFTEYYQDVHNLLALPAGVIMRYDYKRKYLTDEAAKLSTSREPVPVLLIYAQKDAPYERQERKSIDPNGSPVKYVGTRLAKMHNVVVDADNYYFDFEVGGYPNQAGVAFQNIVDSLIQKGHVPWGKLVCTSSKMEDLETISKGEDQDKWVAIVEMLSRPPMQFSGDAFWRLKGPFGGDDASAQIPEVAFYSEGGRPRQAHSFFNSVENATSRFELISETGKVDTVPQQYEVEAKSTEEKVLKVTGSGTFMLRHYTGQMIEYRTGSAALLGSSSADLRLTTRPRGTQWPTGANFPLRFRVRRNRLRLFLGILLGILGIVGFVAGESKGLEAHPWWAAGLKGCGVLCLIVSGFVLTGRLEFKT